MGAFTKLMDIILFFFFIVIAIAAPLIDAQTILPSHIFPDFFINIKKWYTHEFGDYLFSEKPHFFVGLVWIELLLQWPLALFSLYGILTSQPWLGTTCLIYGASVFTSMVALLAEFAGSGKASEKLMMVYYPFVGLGALAILRGLMAESSKSTGSVIIGKRPGGGLHRKKRA